jgi:hypothetical protein
MRRTAALLAVLLCAACGPAESSASAPASTSSSAPAPGPAVPAVPGIEAEVVQLRTDEAIGGQVQVRITATGDEGFTVTAVALDSPGFAPLPDTAVTAEYVPGRTIDLPTPYGAPVCSAAALPAAARVSVVRPDGGAEVLRVPLAAEVLGRIHEKECAVLAVAEVVDIAVTGFREDGDALTGELGLVRRTGKEAVAVTRLDRSVLIDVVADGLPLEMDGDRAATPVSFTPATCDPHVLSETKQPYRFPMLVVVGDDEPVPMDLPLSQADRDLLAALVHRVCAGR